MLCSQLSKTREEGEACIIVTVLQVIQDYVIMNSMQKPLCMETRPVEIYLPSVKVSIYRISQSPAIAAFPKAKFHQVYEAIAFEACSHVCYQPYKNHAYLAV